jgi:phosphatidylglycerophosphate synthase
MTTATDIKGFRAALRHLPAAQKSAKGAPAYSRFVNRKLGRYLAAAAFCVRMSPNQVTIISAFFSFAAIATIAAVRPSLLMGIAVCLLLVIGYALDSADGQLARLTGRGSRAGEWLDHSVDSAKIVTLHAAVLVSFYRFFELPHPALLLVPLVFGCVATVLFFGMILKDLLRRGGPAPAAARPSIVRSLLVIPTDYGLMCLVFVAYGTGLVFVGIYGFLLVTNTLFLAAAGIKWFRELAAADAAAAPPPAPNADVVHKPLVADTVINIPAGRAPNANAITKSLGGSVSSLPTAGRRP